MSKCGIVSAPGEGVDLMPRAATDGSPIEPDFLWPDAHPHVDEGRLPTSSPSLGSREWDVVYRFAQVGVRTPSVDWGSTCGNIISAVACAAISDPAAPIVDYATRLAACRPSRVSAFGKHPDAPREPVMLPLRIALANTGDVVEAKVPLDPLTMQLFEPNRPDEGIVLAGVPGTAAPVELSFPLKKEGQLPTGSTTDVLEVEWAGKSVQLEVTIASTGLINVFIPISALPTTGDLPPRDQVLSAHPADLDSNVALHTFLERVREAGAAKAGFSFATGTAEPKVSLIGPGDGEADVVVRAVSVGNFHRSALDQPYLTSQSADVLSLRSTVPSTTLSALAVASSHSTSVVPSASASPDGLMTFKARHPAGIAEATLRLAPDSEGGGAVSVVVVRTAREIMRGQVLIPNVALA